MLKRIPILLSMIIVSACGSPSQSSTDAPEAASPVQEAASPVRRAYWPDWRGPTADGRSEAAGLPVAWSETENIVWKTLIHDLGHSTPVVWGDRIWLTTAVEDGSALFAVCLELNSGEIVHDIEVFRPKEKQTVHALNSFATPSAVVEEDRVYVHFGRYGTVCLDSNTGERVWERRDLKCNHFQGPASSPVLFEDLLILHFEGFDVQFIVALDKNTGGTVWRTDRPAEIYENPESGPFRQSFETPIIAEVDGKAQLISNGSNLVTGLDPRTGAELWRFVYRGVNTTSRIVGGHGLFFVNHGVVGSQAVLSAVRQGGDGDVTESHVVWSHGEDMPLLSSPVLVGDLLYSVSDDGILKCLEAKTGEEVWSERLSGKFGASLLYADNHIYVCSKRGVTTVIEPGRTFRELAVNKLDGAFSASPVVAGDSLLLRTKTHLYRVKRK